MDVSLLGVLKEAAAADETILVTAEVSTKASAFSLIDQHIKSGYAFGTTPLVGLGSDIRTSRGGHLQKEESDMVPYILCTRIWYEVVHFPQGRQSWYILVSSM